MTVQTQDQNSPWKGENFSPIMKMGIEGTVAVASLAATITTIFVATGAIAGPAFLASVANPVGIAALFVATVYFAVAAYTSYKQLYKNEEISGAVTKAEDAAQKAKDAAQKAEDAAQKAEDAAQKAEDAAQKAEDAAQKAGEAATKTETAKQEVETKAANFVSKEDLNQVNTALGGKLDSDKLEEKVKGVLPTLLQDPKVVTADVKTAMGIAG